MLVDARHSSPTCFPMYFTLKCLCQNVSWLWNKSPSCLALDIDSFTDFLHIINVAELQNGWAASMHLSLWSMCGCSSECMCLCGCLSESQTIHKINILVIMQSIHAVSSLEYQRECNKQDGGNPRPLIQICQFPLRSITSHCESSRLGT